MQRLQSTAAKPNKLGVQPRASPAQPCALCQQVSPQMGRSICSFTRMQLYWLSWEEHVRTEFALSVFVVQW